MSRFSSLVALFVRDLVRRRMLWIIVFIVIGVIGLNYWTAHAMERAVGGGQSIDIATKRAASSLDDLASTVRSMTSYAVIAIAAIVAPESRRNGTTQFVLSLGVGRGVLSAAQFVALTLLIAAGSLALHVGFSIAALSVEAVTFREAILSWPLLMGPLIATAAAVFALSTTFGILETYMVFFGAPFVTGTILELVHDKLDGVPLAPVRAVENLRLLLPDTHALMVWPHLGVAGAGPSSESIWAWPVIHNMLAVTLWILIGAALLRRHDFGSRTALK